MENYTKIENIENDKELDDGKYFLYSVVTPKNILETSTFGIKVKRFENNQEVATKKCDVMGKLDKYFDIYLGYTGRLHPINPTSGQIENQKYRNEKLDKIMKKVHDSEKKDFIDEQNKSENQDEKQNENQDEKQKNVTEEERNENTYNDTMTEFVFSQEDCLDEDKIIQDQRFAVVSFVTPELIHNLSENLFKIRGYSNTYEKANKLSKQYELQDEGKLLIGIVEIGKWTPINLSNLKKMKSFDINNDEKTKMMNYELKELNEIVGRYKKNLDGKKDLLEKRKLEQIKEAAKDFNELNENNEYEILPSSNTTETSEIKELGKNKESVKERLQKTVEQIKNNGVNNSVNNSEPQKRNLNNTNRNLNSRLEKMRKKIAEMQDKNEKKPSNIVQINQEVLRINEKKQNLENLKVDKEKLEEKLSKMKKLLNQKNNM